MPALTDDLKSTLGRKLGPLPAWGWGVAIVGGFFVYRVLAGRKSSDASGIYDLGPGGTGGVLPDLGGASGGGGGVIGGGDSGSGSGDTGGSADGNVGYGGTPVARTGAEARAKLDQWLRDHGLPSGATTGGNASGGASGGGTGSGVAYGGAAYGSPGGNPATAAQDYAATIAALLAAQPSGYAPQSVAIPLQPGNIPAIARTDAYGTQTITDVFGSIRTGGMGPYVGAGSAADAVARGLSAEQIANEYFRGDLAAANALIATTARQAANDAAYQTGVQSGLTGPDNPGFAGLTPVNQAMQAIYNEQLSKGALSDTEITAIYQKYGVIGGGTSDSTTHFAIHPGTGTPGVPTVDTTEAVVLTPHNYPYSHGG